MRKVYDCFLFFNELDLLEIRFNQHYDFVDYFVICESAYTFTGQKKTKLFLENQERFKKFLDKVIYISIDKFPEELDTGARDFYQRQYLLNGIKDAQADDLIIFADVDEIFKEEAIKRALDFDGVSHFRMGIYQFYLNMLIANDWLAPFALPKKFIPNLAVACEVKDASLTFARFHMDRLCKSGNVPVQIVEDSGWHFTFMGGFDVVKAKLRAYAHADDYWPAMMRDDKRLQQVLDIGIKIWSSDELVSYVPIDDSFPLFIQQHQKELIEKGLVRDIYEAHKKLQSTYMDLRKKFAFASLRNEINLEELGNFKPIEYLDYIGKPEVQLEYVGLPEPRGQLISDNCKATQSSRSPWSHGITPEDDASHALTGLPNGNFSFHTDREIFPWWEVDLGESIDISEIRIFNRILPLHENKFVARRASELQIYLSEDRQNYKCIYYHSDIEPIGGVDGFPLILHPKHGTRARYVKVMLGNEEFLHLDKIYIYKN